MLINDNCEVFNSVIVEARKKPIILMLENIRILLMRRIRKHRDDMSRHPGPLCPRIKEKLDNISNDAIGYICEWSGGSS